MTRSSRGFRWRRRLETSALREHFVVAMTNSTSLPQRTQKVRRDVGGGKRGDGPSRKTPRIRPSPERIHLDPSDPALTATAGLVPFGVFLRHQGVDRALHEGFDHLKAVGGTVYRMGDVLRMLIDANVAGELRVFGVEALAPDPLFVRLAGGRLPSVDVPYDDLRRFEPQDVRRLERMVSRHGRAPLQGRSLPKIHLDLDPTVVVLFGLEIEGAVKGYNPKYPGRPSYHPILASVPEVGTVVNAVLRPGNTSFGTEEVPWVLTTFRAVRKDVGPRCEITVRIDGAGDCTDLMKALDQERARLLIKADLTRDLCAVIAQLPNRAWKTVDRDADDHPIRQVAEVDFARQEWVEQGLALRVVAERVYEVGKGKPIPLWEDTNWTVQVVLTNDFEADAETLLPEYNGRAEIEPLIAELKNAWGIGKVPSLDFEANEAMFQLKLLAFNLYRNFLRKHCPALLGWRTAWSRRFLILVPGRLVTGGHTTRLKFSPDSALAKLLN